MTPPPGNINRPGPEGHAVPPGRRIDTAIVAAASENDIIGRDGGLPWRLPDDLAHFKRVTTGRPVIMGRATFDELFRKPLPGRVNIIVSRTLKEAPGTTIRRSLHDALDYAASLVAESLSADDTAPAELCVIGGGQIFRQAMPLATRIVLTRVHAVVQGDTTFPRIPPDQWRLESAEPHAADERHAHAFTIEWWRRS